MGGDHQVQQELHLHATATTEEIRLLSPSDAQGQGEHEKCRYRQVSGQGQLLPGGSSQDIGSESNGRDHAGAANGDVLDADRQPYERIHGMSAAIIRSIFRTSFGRQ